MPQSSFLRDLINRSLGFVRGKKGNGCFCGCFLILLISFHLKDYTLDTGDEVIRFSCVAINMVRTDGILSTGVSIDSAIIGMTAMVFVNGSAVVFFFFFLSSLSMNQN